MSDLASLGLRIESDQADTASARMDKMKASAVGLENATDSLASSTVKSDGAIAGMLASIDRTTKEMLELSRIHQQAGGAALVQAGATEKLTNELQQASTAGMYFASSFKAMQADMGGATRGMNDYAASVGSGTRKIGEADAHMVAYRKHLKDASDQMKHTAREGLGLTRQLADIGVTGASGMSIWMIALQQGPQIFDLFQEKAVRTGTTIRAAMASTAAATWAAVAPLLAVAAPLIAIAAVTGTVVMAWQGAEKSAMELERAASGLGRTAGLTGSELQKLAAAAADQGDVSVRSAERQAVAYVSTGKIGGEMISRLIADGKDLASFLGKDLPEATEYLAKAMEDPEKAGKEMTRTFGLLTQEQIKQIDAAKKAGDMYRAQTILMDALSGAAEGHAAKVGVMTSAWDALAKAASNAWTWMGKALYMDESERLQNVINRRASIEQGQRENGRPLDARTQGIYDNLGREGHSILSARAARDARDQQAAANQAAQLAADSADKPKKVSTAREDSLRRELEALRATTAANYDLAKAYGVSDAAALKAQATADATGRAIRRQGDIDAFVAAQLQLNASKEAARSAQAISDLQFETTARAKANAAMASGLTTSTEANEALALESQLRPLIAAAAVIEGERKEALLKLINDLTEAQKANNAANREAQLIQQNAADQNRIASLRDQIRFVGPRTRQSAVMQSVFDTERDLASAGEDPNTGAYREAMDNAATLAGLQHDLTAAQFRYNDSLTITGDLLAQIDNQARSVGQGLADSFGAAGEALGGLLTAMTGYQAEIESIREQEAAYALQGGNDQRRLAQFAQDRAQAEVESYGTALSAAKGFFSEGSDGYRALQAAEAAYRVFQFAMSVQAMAMGAAETSAHVAQSGVKAAASTAAGAANIFEKLGPFGFPVVAAMLAVLASLGMKGKGGSGGGSTSSVDASVSTSQGYSQQASKVQDSFASSVAQRVEVKVTADRDGLNAYVAQTAGEVAAPMVAQGMAAASGATRAQVFSDLDKSRTYSRG